MAELFPYTSIWALLSSYKPLLTRSSAAQHATADHLHHRQQSQIVLRASMETPLKPFNPATILHPTLRWRPLERGNFPSEVADWIADNGSLTQRLQRLGRFHVIPQQQRITPPRAEEAHLLGLTPRRAALIREVLLYLDDIPVVFARSVLPLTSLHGRNRILGHMARRSLGAELFKAPRAQRERVWTTKANISTRSVVGSVECFGRQSLFRKRGQPLLVAEFFLPALFDREGL